MAFAEIERSSGVELLVPTKLVVDPHDGCVEIKASLFWLRKTRDPSLRRCAPLVRFVGECKVLGATGSVVLARGVGARPATDVVTRMLIFGPELLAVAIEPNVADDLHPKSLLSKKRERVRPVVPVRDQHITVTVVFDHLDRVRRERFFERLRRV